MRFLREFYDKYPMITVRLIAFLGGIPLVCVVMLIIHQLLGMEVYQYMYTPLLAFFASVYLFFLRKATVVHINEESLWSNKQRFYSCYHVFLGVTSVIFLISSICAFLGLI